MRVFTIAAFALALAGGSAFAQNDVVSLQVTAADKSAQHFYGTYKAHPLGLMGTNRSTQWVHGAALEGPATHPVTVTGATTVPSVPAPGFYPGDLSNLAPAGPTIQSATSNNVYVNCAPTPGPPGPPGPHPADPGSCWGSPATFLTNLGSSTFIHVADQYVGSTANNRYTVGKAGSLTYPIATTLGDNDILNIVHAGAAALGSGYNHLIHVFLPKGVDVCFTGTSECYSPDVPSTFVFCAYHGEVTFGDKVGHVIFSVEPYQNVNGCSVATPTPNSLLVDSTADVLSHELFEMITDPDLNAWLNNVSLDLYQAEIGDECQNATFAYGTVSLNGVNYQVQPEYSNKYHGCVYVP